MIISYETRFFLYDLIGNISFIMLGYTIALRLWHISIPFLFLAYLVRMRLYNTIERQYKPELI